MANHCLDNPAARDLRCDPAGGRGSQETGRVRETPRMAAQAAPKTPRFDLQDVDPGRRAKAWSDALNEYFFRYDVEYPTEFRIGEFDGVAADGLRLATMTADPMHVERHASH